MKKTLFLILAAILLPIVCWGQEEKMTKEQKKAAIAIAQKDLYDRAVEAMNDRNFIVQADELSYQNDKTNPVSPGANFVSLEGEEAIIEIFPGTSFLSQRNNFRIKGTASNIEMRTNKKGKVTFRMYVTSNEGHVTVSIMMDNKSNKSTVILTPDFSGDRISLYGKAYRMNKSEKPFYVD